MDAEFKYKTWSHAERTVIAQAVAASEFEVYSDPENRGPAWTPASIPHFVEKHISRVISHSNVDPKLHDAYRTEMVKAGLEFYANYLDGAMKQLFELQKKST